MDAQFLIHTIVKYVRFRCTNRRGEQWAYFYFKLCLRFTYSSVGFWNYIYSSEYR